jgi:hypothetical protein
MVNAPNRAPEVVGTAEDSAEGFLERMMHRFDRPPTAANDNGVPAVVALNNRRETLNDTVAESSWLRRNVIDRFSSRTESSAERLAHSREVEGDLRAVRENVDDLAEVWRDDPQLKTHIDDYQRYNRKHGDQARYIVESQIEGLGENDSVPLLVIDENTTPEEIEAHRLEQEAYAAQQEENRLRDEAVARWGEFAVQSEPGGRWRSRRLSESAFSWENIKETWQNSTNIFSFFKNLGADYTQWRAVKEAVPTVNVVSFGVRTGQATLEQYRETGENIAHGAELVGEARSTQREVKREGAETVVLLNETARSDYIRNQMMRLMRGEVSREQVLTSTRAAFSRFERQDPRAFARMIQGYGVTARSLNTKAGFYELFKNAALWYTPWGDRGERNFWEANETAVPIWGSYAAWRDIKVENGLPFWTRVGFASVGTALDIGTVLSFGTLSPVVAGAKIGMVKAGQALGRRAVQRAAVEAGEQASRRTLAQVLGSLPRAARNAVTGAGAKSFALGAAGYTALSAGIDYLFDVDQRVIDGAILAAETAVGQEFSYQQRRLLRVVGQDVEPIVRDAYADYRDEEEVVPNPDTEPIEEAADIEVASTNAAPTLTDGQIADVLEREAA